MFTVFATSEQDEREEEQRARVELPEHAREPASRHHADARAHELHGGHEREGEERRPERGEAEGGAGGGVGGDPRGIVVRRARDQPGPEPVEEAARHAHRFGHAAPGERHHPPPLARGAADLRRDYLPRRLLIVVGDDAETSGITRWHAPAPRSTLKHIAPAANLGRYLNSAMPDLPTPRRALLDSAKKFLATQAEESLLRNPVADPPRLTLKALEKTAMSRSRERILGNLDDMYREAFERAKTTGDDAQMATLDFAYRREQLYFEILLDVRDAIERSGR